MKKFLSLLLSIAIIASMAVVSMAASTGKETGADNTKFDITVKFSVNNPDTYPQVYYHVTKVSLEQGGSVLDSANARLDGYYDVVEFKDVAAGYYNLVAETDNNGKTSMVIHVDAENTSFGPYEMTGAPHSTKIEAASVPGVYVNCLHSEINNKAYEYGHSGKYHLTIAIDDTAEDTNDPEQAAIISYIESESASDKPAALSFYSIDLAYGNSLTAQQPLTETSVGMEIYIPFTEGTPTHVYRYHEDNGVGLVEELCLNEGNSSEHFEYDGKYIIITAKKFSTYAIGYTPNATTSGGNGIVLEGPFIYKPEYRAMMDEGFEYGEPVYYLIKDETIGEVEISNKKYAEKLKVKADWNMGDSAVKGVSVVKKFVDPATEEDCTDIAEAGYYYFLEINTLEKKGVAETDVAGVIKFDRKADSKKGVDKIDDCKVDVDFTLFYPNTWLTDEWGSIGAKGAELEWDTPYVLKFDYDDETELTFGYPSGGYNEGVFTVDVSGQGKIYLEYTTEADDAIAAANEGAKLEFLTFKGINGIGVKFNRTGEFVYEMENAAYAYEVVDGKLAPIAGLEVEDGEFIFSTNTLKAYVFSDTELVQPA